MRIQPLVRAAARRPRTTILLWLVLVVGCVAAGTIAGTKTLTDAETGVGESATADARLEAAGLGDPAVERILVTADAPADAQAAATALVLRVERDPAVAEADGPADDPRLQTDGGRTGLVVVTLRGDPEDAGDRVAGVERAVAAVAAAHDGALLQQAGAGTISNAFDDVIEDDLRRAELLSLPIILVILLVAFGAIVAASIPLLLGITSVAAAMGAFGVVSHLVPDSGSTAALIVLIGLAVGVDYSLFYIRREREERRAGRGPEAALDIAAATVGRAIVVSGLTVMISIAGLFITGLSVFSSLALGTIIVVAIAVLGSLTVLPAVLALLGDRIDRGRLPGLGRPRVRQGIWAPIARAVTRRPVAWLVTAVCLLAALAVPAMQLELSETTLATGLPKELPVAQSNAAIERAFPGAPEDAELVVTARGLDDPAARERLEALGVRAMEVTGGRGQVAVVVADDGRTARVAVPMPDRGIDEAEATVTRLRDDVAPTAAEVAPGAEALVTGGAAGSKDFTDRLSERTPLVIAFVLALAFVLLLAAFRSARLAASVMALNLLSAGATFGILAAVFQHTWAEGLLDFESTGTVVSWIPLFSFVILFGLSMDYTILVLERMREARRAGRTPREAAAEGVAATGAAVTSAAVVMVGVFSVFAMLRMPEMKQMGVGLAAAILIDATLVRGVALPAAVTLLGARGWRVRRARRGWDDRSPMSAPSTQPVAHDG